MHEVLVNRLGGQSLPRKSVVRLTDRPDMTLDVYRGGKATMQQQQQNFTFSCVVLEEQVGKEPFLFFVFVFLFLELFLFYVFGAFKGVEYSTILIFLVPCFLSCMLL